MIMIFTHVDHGQEQMQLLFLSLDLIKLFLTFSRKTIHSLQNYFRSSSDAVLLKFFQRKHSSILLNDTSECHDFMRIAALAKFSNHFYVLFAKLGMVIKGIYGGNLHFNVNWIIMSVKFRCNRYRIKLRTFL